MAMRTDTKVKIAKLKNMVGNSPFKTEDIYQCGLTDDTLKKYGYIERITTTSKEEYSPEDIVGTLNQYEESEGYFGGFDFDGKTYWEYSKGKFFYVTESYCWKFIK